MALYKGSSQKLNEFQTKSRLSMTFAGLFFHRRNCAMPAHIFHAILLFRIPSSLTPSHALSRISGRIRLIQLQNHVVRPLAFTIVALFLSKYGRLLCNLRSLLKCLISFQNQSSSRILGILFCCPSIEFFPSCCAP